jgi:hypothetical protein
MYAEGDDVALDVGAWLAPGFSVSFSADRFDHSLRAFRTRVITTTAGMGLNWNLFRSLYSAVNLDHIWEGGNRMMRGYLEMGVQF